MTCGTCWKKTMCGDKREQNLALLCVTVLVIIFNYGIVRPWERFSLDVIVYIQCALFGLLVVLQVAGIVSFCFVANRPKIALQISQYLLGVLFLTATIDGFICEAIGLSGSNQASNNQTHDVSQSEKAKEVD